MNESFMWLKEPDSIGQQQARQDLNTAHDQFFKNLDGHPRFKSKHDKQSYRTVRTNGNIQIDFEKRKLKLPKVRWVQCRDGDRWFDEDIKSVTVTRTKGGQYHASMQIEKKINVQEKTTIRETKIASFDMSCNEFMVSTGETRFINPRFHAL
ncbi:MAG: hypothetical protein ACTSUE_23155 [Promethearchaeota archaeon]